MVDDWASTVSAGRRMKRFDQMLGDARGQQRLTGRDKSDAGEQFGGRGVLEHEPAGAGAERGEDVLVEVEGGQDQDAYAGAAVVGQDSPGGFETVHDGHPDVHQDDVGLGAEDEVDGFDTVCGAADDVDVGRRLEEDAESGAQQGLVVDHGNADHRDSTAGPIGSSTLSRNPPSGSGPACDVPPNSAARSRIPVRP